MTRIIPRNLCRKALISLKLCNFLCLHVLGVFVLQSYSTKVYGSLTDDKQSLIPQASRLDLSYEDEYQAFETELLSSMPKSRTKRFVYLNSDTSSAVALIVGVPLTLVLPSLSNIFNKWRRRRSLRDIEEMDRSFDDDPTVQPHLDRISTYFELIDIPEYHCQLRAICEFSADPEKYYPLSDMIISRIRNPSLPAMLYFENDSPLKTSRSGNNTSDSSKPTSLFRIYNDAANEGLSQGNDKCEKSFGKQCQYSMDKLLNMPTLRFWTGMQSLLRLSFRDADSTF